MRIKRKKGKSITTRPRNGNEHENDSIFKESTIYGTSKYLNHTQLKNETESLGLLNTRLLNKPSQLLGKSQVIVEGKFARFPSPIGSANALRPGDYHGGRCY